MSRPRNAVKKLSDMAAPRLAWCGLEAMRPARRSQDRETRPGKKSAISRAADSGESEPWIRFSVVLMARSPRMVPGAASAGLVAPIMVRTTA